jgi:dTMP kinase
MKNKLIVIEGGDGSGKATQVGLLGEVLKKKAKVTVMDFPQYDRTLSGKLVGRYLSGEFGDPVKISPYVSSLPYILDRLVAKEEIEKALSEGVVLCNRYTPSNIGHQASKLEGKEKNDFILWLEELEYEELGLPRPDLVIYLHVSPEISSRLVEMKAKRSYIKGQETKDGHEKNISYQQRVADVYREVSLSRSDWQIVECVENGDLLSREEIHQKIMKVLNLPATATAL